MSQNPEREIDKTEKSEWSSVSFHPHPGNVKEEKWSGDTKPCASYLNKFMHFV